MERKSAWKRYNEEQLNDLEQFAADYKEFISECKTERECVNRAVSMAKVCGFKNLQEVIARGEVLVPGDRVYSVQMGKQIMLAVIGREPIEKGMRIIGAHIDSPRMDIKQNPLYEAGKMAYMDTHYYGGIKKYQWVTLPLALHGIVCKKDKSAVSLSIGEDPEDPVFCVSDLLIHLAADQMSKPASQAIEGEKLDILIAGRPKINISSDKDGDAKDDKEKEKENVKSFVLDKLRDIGIDEADFQSAELEVVPAGPARDLGLDRSMILGYGHDDRSCAYPTLMALLHMDTPRYTSVGLLVDKEEIGSVGATGMHSKYFENMVAEMINCMTE
ncbi:MAG: aminopeptidase, partial [Lachnospiraceae bacterium]|nr:aminopeptidase [Lachnospiraceae bacterium]